MHSLITERLRLRMVEQSDAHFIEQLYNTPDFLQFIGDKQIRSQADAVKYIEEKILAMHQQHGVCLLLVERLDSQEKLGVCGLIKRPELAAYDIGYGFLPSTYGQGFGYEAGQAVINYAKQRSNIDELVAITTSDNVGSRALLTKLGFTYVKVQEPISDTVDLLLYQMNLTRA